MNVFFVQLHGRKRFTLVAPAFTPRVYNEVGVYSEVDPEQPDYRAHPAFRGVPTTSIVLEPGDTLFLPIGWWHRVESLDVSISLSFTNFVHLNEFRWQNPDG
jgi:ribosomal protein L16 Arg81 hydroxylase